jgi:hypothetical protein
MDSFVLRQSKEEIELQVCFFFTIVIHVSLFLLLILRPCVRRKFQNFSFLRVSEMFGFQSSEFLGKTRTFQNRKNFAKIVQKQVLK